MVGEPAIWQRLSSIMTATTTPDAISATVTSNLEEVLDHWGPARAHSGPGPAWTRMSPVAQQDAATPEAVIVDTGTTTLIPPALTGRSYSIQMAAPLVTIDPVDDPQQVYGWLHDSASLRFKPNGPPGQYFCTIAECRCPPDQPGAIPPNQPLSAPLTGGLQGGTGIAITGFDLDQFCSSRPDVSGTWHGAWASSRYPISGGFVAVLARIGTALTGTLSISGSSCVSGGTLTGSINGNAIEFGAVEAEKQIAFTGTVNGSTMHGSWAAAGCGDDAGGWSATKAR